jgi:hypothetical protein
MHFFEMLALPASKQASKLMQPGGPAAIPMQNGSSFYPLNDTYTSYLRAGPD